MTVQEAVKAGHAPVPALAMPIDADSDRGSRVGHVPASAAPARVRIKSLNSSGSSRLRACPEFGTTTYTIIVTNSGPSDAQTVKLTDATPLNTTFVSFTAPVGRPKEPSRTVPPTRMFS